jgi:thiamine-phosphate pyrophosphorylase
VKPVICMITDRLRRGEASGSVDTLVGRVAAAAQAGVHLVQIRERDLDARSLVRLVAACVETVQHTPTRIVVNDRTDVARAAGAHGVHLRGDSVPASRVRAIAGPGFLIGRSIHSTAEAVEAATDGAADYLIFGPVFSTASKPGVTPAGPAMLEAVVRAMTIPVLGVGGVTAATAPVLARAGAAGAAAIALFADPDGAARVYDAVTALRRAFDSAGGGS